MPSGRALLAGAGGLVGTGLVVGRERVDGTVFALTETGTVAALR